LCPLFPYGYSPGWRRGSLHTWRPWEPRRQLERLKQSINYSIPVDTFVAVVQQCYEQTDTDPAICLVFEKFFTDSYPHGLGFPGFEFSLGMHIRIQCPNL
jgi:hypothetical protein